MIVSMKSIEKKRDSGFHNMHYLVPAGGVAADGPIWLAARNKFLFPVKALSKISRAGFRDALQKTACVTVGP